MEINNDFGKSALKDVLDTAWYIDLVARAFGVPAEILMEDKRGKGMNLLEEFANDILYGVGGYQDFKYYEMAFPKNDADVALVIWVLQCLANKRHPMSQKVIDAIITRREEQETS